MFSNGHFLSHVADGAKHGADESLLSARLGSEPHIVQHTHAGEQANVLKSARDSGDSNFVWLTADQILRLQKHPSTVRLIDAGEQVEDTGFASAIWSDQSVKRQRRQLKRE